MRRIPKSGLVRFQGGRSKAVVPFGGGDVNGIRQISGGLGIATADNNASFIAQLQMKY
jgi:hypothetical protein